MQSMQTICEDSENERRDDELSTASSTSPCDNKILVSEIERLTNENATLALWRDRQMEYTRMGHRLEQLQHELLSVRAIDTAEINQLREKLQYMNDRDTEIERIVLRMKTLASQCFEESGQHGIPVFGKDSQHILQIERDFLEKKLNEQHCEMIKKEQENIVLREENAALSYNCRKMETTKQDFTDARTDTVSSDLRKCYDEIDVLQSERSATMLQIQELRDRCAYAEAQAKVRGPQIDMLKATIDCYGCELKDLQKLFDSLRKDYDHITRRNLILPLAAPALSTDGVDMLTANEQTVDWAAKCCAIHAEKTEMTHEITTLKVILQLRTAELQSAMAISEGLQKELVQVC